MWRYILAVPFLVHGLAHLSGFLASWSSGSMGYKKTPWIFSSGIMLESPAGKTFGLLWLLAMIGFVGTALGIAWRQPWWPPLAMAVCAISLVVIIPWWNTVPPGAKFGAIFDVIVIALLLLPAKQKILELIG